MVTDEYCFAEVGLPCLNSSATAFGSMLYNSCCVLFCSIRALAFSLLPVPQGALSISPSVHVMQKYILL